MTTIRLDPLCFVAARILRNGSRKFPARKLSFSISKDVRLRSNSKDRSWSMPLRCPGADSVFRSRSSRPIPGVRIVENLQRRAPCFWSMARMEKLSVSVFIWPRRPKSQPYRNAGEWCHNRSLDCRTFWMRDWRPAVKARCRVYGAGLMLVILFSCSRGAPEQPATGIPPALPAPSAPATTTADAYEVSAVADGGSVGGTITISGPILKLPARKISKDTQVCGTAVRESQKLIVNRTGGLKNAVVIVDGVK